MNWKLLFEIEIERNRELAVERNYYQQQASKLEQKVKELSCIVSDYAQLNQDLRDELEDTCLALGESLKAQETPITINIYT